MCAGDTRRRGAACLLCAWGSVAGVISTARAFVSEFAAMHVIHIESLHYIALS